MRLPSLLVLLTFSFNCFAETKNTRFRMILYYLESDRVITDQQIVEQFKKFERVKVLPEKSEESLFSVTYENDIQKDYPVPKLESLRYFARGLSKEQADLSQNVKRGVLFDVLYVLDGQYDEVKEASEAIYNLAISSNSLIWDSETRELFSPDSWKEERVDSWEGMLPNIPSNINIHAYEKEGGVRAITLGMAKFGLPDVVVNGFTWSMANSVGSMMDLAVQLITEGLYPDDKSLIALDINKLENASLRESLIAESIEGAGLKTTVKIGDAVWEEGDPNNYLVEILFDNAPGESISERLAATVDSLFGQSGGLSYVEHNNEIELASQRAKKRLKELKPQFIDGFAPGTVLSVKAPFETQSNSVEWMWVEVVKWQGETINGILKNQPYDVPELNRGAEVVVSEQDVFDYILDYSDGRSEGNETGALIQKYQQN